jgi:integrase
MKNRGMGGIYRPSYRDKKTGERVSVPGWWIYYNQRGRQIKENARTTKESEARRLLRKRLGEVEAGKPVGPELSRTTFEDLVAMVIDDHKVNKRRSLYRYQHAIAHLREFFAGDKASDITPDRIMRYVALRQEEGKAANATINSELAVLGRMFTLAVIAGKVASKPHIAMLKVQNARKGFFEADQFLALLRHLPEELKPVAITAYSTGWRLHDEVLTRQRHHLDLQAGWLRLEPGETKNYEGRMFPLTPMLREALEAQVRKTELLQREKGAIIPWLFHRGGKPIKSFTRSWRTACKRAGIPGKIPHDFRRTAVRNLERAGVPRSAAMAMVGHKTLSIYTRYAIVDEHMLKAAALKLGGLNEADKFERKVEKY